MIQITLPDNSQREFPQAVTVAEVAASIGAGLAKAALGGKAATQLWEGERKFAVAVRLPENRRSLASLAATPIPTPDGGYAALGSVANIRETSGAMNIAREAGRRTMAIGIFIKNRDMGSVVADMQARVAKKKQHVIELKEVKYRPGIDDHDFETKTRHARRFLEEKNKVKVTMMFRGRQVAHPELGQQVLDRVSSSLADIGKIESAGRLEGKSMTMILTPK